jgi:hypothetical protein
VSFPQSDYVSGIFDYCALETKAQPEIRDPLPASVAGRKYLAFDAAPAEAAGYQDPVEVFEV